MRKLFVYALLLTLVSCKGKNAGQPGDLEPKTLAKLLGSFTGPFGDKQITMLITRVEKNVVEGRTIVAGNDRPFSGTISEKDGAYTIAAREPGDDAHDGIFQFTIQSGDLDRISGKWEALDKNITPKEYQLARQSFTYNPSVGDYPEASQRELKEEDVENMMKSELQAMRNEIYARHGYCFKRKEMRDMFEHQDWYIPASTDVRSVLTPIEKKNIELIKRYEKFAEDYGDDFGR